MQRDNGNVIICSNDMLHFFNDSAKFLWALFRIDPRLESAMAVFTDHSISIV